jgi:vanillate O-demethylase monooxygenase subunit
MPYIQNIWYPLCFSRDVGRHPQRRTAIEKNVVLYRKEDGTAVALDDLCPHRFAPLSLGAVRGDHLQCGYHGMTFDGSGKCVRIPGQDLIPASAQVRSYPVADRLGLVWIWPGDPALADPSAIQDLPQYHDTQRWSVVHGESLAIDASYLSLCDNLTDPSHVSFVHASTLGNAASENVPVKHDRIGDKVVVHRWIMDAPVIPVFGRLKNFAGMVDRWHYYHFHAPSIAIIDFGTADTGLIDPETGDRDQGMRIFACHYITPIDERRCIDHWSHVRNFALGDEAVGTEISRQLAFAFNEDKLILEAIQREEDRLAGRQRPLRLGIDGGSLKMRRVISDLIEREQGPAADAAPSKALA